MEKWKTIEPNVWKPDQKGDHIIGVLVNKEPKDENSGISARYYLENKEGTFFVWGCAVLDDRMQYAKIGEKIKITYEGGTTNKRNQKVNLYRVDVSVDESAGTPGAESKNDKDEEAFPVEQLADVKGGA